MPKLFVYLGVIVFFYSKEHEPIHVHGFYQGRESKAEVTVRDGKVVKITYGKVAKMKPLRRSEMVNFKELVEAKADGAHLDTGAGGS